MPQSDDQLLLVRVEARLTKFEKQMAKATGTADRSARRIETRFRRMDSQLGAIGRGIARSLLAPLAALASARELAQAADAFTRIQNALKVVGLEGAAAAAVFERLFQAAQKNAAPIESLVELYGRAALVQSELGVSTEELLHFTEGVAAALRVSGRSAAESSGALLQLSQALGSGVVRAEEFNSILEGALPIAQAAARGLQEAGGSVAKLRTLVINGKVSSEAFFRAFEAGQGTLETLAESADITLGQALTRVKNSFIRLVGAMNDATGAGPGLVRALSNIAGALDALPDKMSAFLDRLRELRSLDPLSSHLEDANRRLKELSETAAREGAGTAGAVEDAAGRAEKAAARIAQAFADASGAEVKTVSLKDFAAPAGTKGARGKKTPQETFGQDVARLRERTEALRLETTLVGESTEAHERALEAQRLLNEAKRAGLQITPELRSQISAEADAYARASQLLEDAEGRYRQIQELGQFAGDSLMQAFKDIVPAIETGNVALDGFINRLIDAALQASLLGSGPLSLFAGGDGGGQAGGLIGRLFGGFRAAGGPVSPGMNYVVGERGPEIFTPRMPGQIVPGGGAAQLVETRVKVEPSPLFITTVDSRVRASEETMARQLGAAALAERRARYG